MEIIKTTVQGVKVEESIWYKWVQRTPFKNPITVKPQ